jgi:bifunctional DNA-binding transcriptional regulator/antitoxin component of YhaV-PrlF toxin-antitoxin module
MESSKGVETYTVQMGPDGKLELPANFRSEFNLEAGDPLILIRIDGHWIITPKPLVVPEMADKIAGLVDKAGLTVEDLIAGLETVGQQLYEEQYGRTASA